jgi:hypothetical protein
MKAPRAAALAALLAAGACPALHAQDIEPRSYWNIPVGMNFVIAGVIRSEGGLATAPNLPIRDAHIRTDLGFLAYARGLDFWGKSGKVDVLLPFADLSGTATVLDQPAERKVSGLVDPRVRASINLYGAPALSPQEFSSYRQDLVIGTSVELVLPLGQYDSQRLINLGTHRWSVKPEIGLSKALGPWSVEAAAAVAFYGSNDNFFGGHTLQQAPVYYLQASVTRTFSGGIWAALGATYYLGGRTTLDGITRDDALGNSRLGFTAAVPINRAHSIKVNVSTGVLVRTGSDFDSIGIAWQYRWLDR